MSMTTLATQTLAPMLLKLRAILAGEIIIERSRLYRDTFPMRSAAWPCCRSLPRRFHPGFRGAIC